MNLLLRLHPSVLLLALAKVYRDAELTILSLFARDRLLWLIMLAVGMILLSATWLATPLSSRIRQAQEKAARRLPRIVFPPVLGGWREAALACEKAERAARMVPRPERPASPVEEHIADALQRLKSTCRIVKTAPFPLQALPLWGWAKRRVMKAALTALALSGVVSAEEAERLLS